MSDPFRLVRPIAHSPLFSWVKQNASFLVLPCLEATCLGTSGAKESRAEDERRLGTSGAKESRAEDERRCPNPSHYTAVQFLGVWGWSGATWVPG